MKKLLIGFLASMLLACGAVKAAHAVDALLVKNSIGSIADATDSCGWPCEDDSADSCGWPCEY